MEEELLLNLSPEKSRDLGLQATDYNSKDSLFTILLKEADSIATMKIARKSVDIDDIRFAKAMLYCNDILRKKVYFLAKGLSDKAQRVGRDN